MPRKSAAQRANDRRWDEAVDWLLNSRHTADLDIQRPFWAYMDGLITRDELDTFGWREVQQREADREGATDDNP